MLSNQFVHELDSSLINLSYIRTLALKQLEKETVTDGYTRINVSDDQYLSEIRSRFPFLTDWFNVYQMGPNGGTPVHIDAHRKAAFNIPIEGCDTTSAVVYYDSADGNEIKKWYKENERHYRVTSQLKEIYRFSMVLPTLVRNDIPHSVERANGKTRRVIGSWGTIGTFEECKQAFINAGC
jgi:hypothetical protein